MFLKIYDLVKLPVVSSASRNVYKFVNIWSLQDKFKKLSLYKPWKAGRNSIYSKIITRTKTSRLRRCKTLKINYHFRYNRLGFISYFQIIPFTNKVVSLIYFANGAVSYYRTGQYHRLFSFLSLNRNRNFKRYLNKVYHSPLAIVAMLWQVKKLSFVSLLEITPGKGAQYTRSNGTSSKIIRFDKDAHTVLAQLPSRVKKVFSYYSFVSLGHVVGSQHAKCFNSKAGYWRSFGVKSIVRGVAMNPVDHPHGGRTKSVKYPRTPWGKTTKFK